MRFAFDRVRWRIGWCDGRTVIAGVDCTGWLMFTLGIGTGSMYTLGVGAPTITLGGGAGGVTGSSGRSCPDGAEYIALARGTSMAQRLLVACNWSFLRSCDPPKLLL